VVVVMMVRVVAETVHSLRAYLKGRRQRKCNAEGMSVHCEETGFRRDGARNALS
jgi:hypothetical protein